MNIKIGYQGIKNSYSYEAALKLSKKFNNVELIGLTTSKNVIDKLKNQEIDYGVVAIKNSIAGEVEETKKALKKYNYKIFDKIDLEIHHSIFKLKNIKLENIKYVASHIQALNQTCNYINKFFPNVKKIITEDTAICTTKLLNNMLPKETIIICNKKLQNNKLELLKENIENDKNNKTTFYLIK
ncbi:MAG: hypothetical protein IKG58_01200 [Bacilli bacterium]|nr:hypothetical protein [Bacilli bacterium]